MVLSYNLKLRETPFNETHQLALPPMPEIPFRADLETIERIKSTIVGSYRMWQLLDYSILVKVLARIRYGEGARRFLDDANTYLSATAR